MRILLELAIFILATTRPFQKESSWDSRIVPIFRTWGRDIEHLYFVFGTNQFDHDFLIKNCQDIERNGGPTYSKNQHRNLVANFKQTNPENQTILYRCSDIISADKPPAGQSISNSNASPKASYNSKIDSNANGYATESKYLNALWTGNCTGEYFGFGPTCRCQESLRYLYYSPKFKDVNWFVFMDDDVYIRPPSLLSMLNQFPSKPSSAAVALISSSIYRGFGFSKFWPKLANVNCKVDGVHSYAIAMPGVINRRALELMAPAVDANGMTELHSLWGGSHDAILGMLFWMYQIDTYSFTNSYVDRTSLTTDILNRINKTTTLFVHRVKNMKLYPKVRKVVDPQMGNFTEPKIRSVPSAYDLYSYFNDAEESADDSLQRGVASYPALIKLVESGILKTVFAKKALEMRSSKKYYPYQFEDCAILH